MKKLYWKLYKKLFPKSYYIKQMQREIFLQLKITPLPQLLDYEIDNIEFDHKNKIMYCQIKEKRPMRINYELKFK